MKSSFKLLKQSRFHVFVLSSTVFCNLAHSVCHCESADKNDDWYIQLAKNTLSNASKDFRLDELQKLAHSQFNETLPSQLGFGFLTGFCSGYSLKKVSKVSAVVLGFFFISIQTLSYNGYLKVNMDKLQKDVDGALDLNKDGKVDMQDLKVAYDKLYPVLAYQLPTGGSFAAGLILGLRS